MNIEDLKFNIKKGLVALMFGIGIGFIVCSIIMMVGSMALGSFACQKRNLSQARYIPNSCATRAVATPA